MSREEGSSFECVAASNPSISTDEFRGELGEALDNVDESQHDNIEETAEYYEVEMRTLLDAWAKVQKYAQAMAICAGNGTWCSCMNCTTYFDRMTKAKLSAAGTKINSTRARIVAAEAARIKMQRECQQRMQNKRKWMQSEMTDLNSPDDEPLSSVPMLPSSE